MDINTCKNNIFILSSTHLKSFYSCSEAQNLMWNLMIEILTERCLSRIGLITAYYAAEAGHMQDKSPICNAIYSPSLQ